MEATKLRIDGLIKLDQLELEKQLGKSIVEFQTGAAGKGTYGELATVTAVVIVSLKALQVAGLHLARKHNKQSFQKTVEIVHPDGRIEKTTIEVDIANTDKPEVQVMKQLGKALNIDISSLLHQG